MSYGIEELLSDVTLVQHPPASKSDVDRLLSHCGFEAPADLRSMLMHGDCLLPRSEIALCDDRFVLRNTLGVSVPPDHPIGERIADYFGPLRDPDHMMPNGWLPFAVTDVRHGILLARDSRSGDPNVYAWLMDILDLDDGILQDYGDPDLLGSDEDFDPSFDWQMRAGAIFPVATSIYELFSQ